MEYISPEKNPYYKESAECVLSAGFVLVELQGGEVRQPVDVVDEPHHVAPHLS